jgi:hypothetical protein
MPHDVRRILTRVSGFAAAALLALAVPLVLARGYQDRHVASEITRRLTATQQPVQFTARDVGASTALDVKDLPAERDARGAPGTARSEYLVAQLGGPRCSLARVPIRVQYEKPFEQGGYTQTIWADLPTDDQATTSLLVPVFFRFDPGLLAVRFRGFELPRGDEGCVARLSRIADQGQFGLLFEAVLPPDWRSFPLHQRLAKLEPRFVSHYPTFATQPRNLRLTRRLLTEPLVAPAEMFRNPALRPTPAGTLRMNTDVATPMDYLLQLKTVELGPDGRFVVRGYIHAGGLTVGLLRDNRWFLVTHVIRPGPFVVALATDTKYPSSLVIANNVQNGSMKTDFEITGAGWFPSDPPP